MNIRKYTKRPVEVEAIQVQLSNRGWISRWAGGHVEVGDDNEKLLIKTLEGEMTANIGDWVVRGIEGEFYPVKDSVFRKTYELVNGDSED